MVVALNRESLNRTLLWLPHQGVSRTLLTDGGEIMEHIGSQRECTRVQTPIKVPDQTLGHLLATRPGIMQQLPTKTFSCNTNTLDETGRAAADWFSIWKFLIKSNGGQWTSLIDSYDNFKQFPTDLRNDDRPRCSDLQQRGYVRLIIPSFEHLRVLLLFGEAF